MVILPIGCKDCREYFPVSQLWVTPSVLTLVTLDLIEFPKEYWVFHIYCTDSFISPSCISSVPPDWRLVPGDRRVHEYSILATQSRVQKCLKYRSADISRENHAHKRLERLVPSSFYWPRNLCACVVSRICSVRVCFSNAKTNNLTVVTQGGFLFQVL